MTTAHDLLREARRILTSLISNTRLTLEEEEDPDYIPNMRVINIDSLADDPLHGDAPELVRRISEYLDTTDEQA